MRFNNFDDFVQYLIWDWVIHPVRDTLILLLLIVFPVILIVQFLTMGKGDDDAN